MKKIILISIFNLIAFSLLAQWAPDSSTIEEKFVIMGSLQPQTISLHHFSVKNPLETRHLEIMQTLERERPFLQVDLPAEDLDVWKESGKLSTTAANLYVVGGLENSFDSDFRLLKQTSALAGWELYAQTKGIGNYRENAAQFGASLAGGYWSDQWGGEVGFRHQSVALQQESDHKRMANRFQGRLQYRRWQVHGGYIQETLEQAVANLDEKYPFVFARGSADWAMGQWFLENAWEASFVDAFLVSGKHYFRQGIWNLGISYYINDDGLTALPYFKMAKERGIIVFSAEVGAEAQSCLLADRMDQLPLLLPEQEQQELSPLFMRLEIGWRQAQWEGNVFGGLHFLKDFQQAEYQNGYYSWAETQAEVRKWNVGFCVFGRGWEIRSKVNYYEKTSSDSLGTELALWPTTEAENQIRVVWKQWEQSLRIDYRQAYLNGSSETEETACLLGTETVFHWNPQLSFYLECSNLMNAEYWAAPGFQGKPRQVQIGLRYLW